MRGPRKITVLVFGESSNDTSAIMDLIKAIHPRAQEVFVRPQRTPIVHLRGADRPQTRLDTAERIARTVRAAGEIYNVVGVVAHQDCDALEPAHILLSETIEAELTRAGVPQPVAATPAWDIEAWWMLFPTALARTRRCWRKINYGGRNVGFIAESKRELTRNLRPTNAQKGRCPDYAESDSIAIARKIREIGLTAETSTASSGSFERFCEKVRGLELV